MEFDFTYFFVWLKKLKVKSPIFLFKTTHQFANQISSFLATKFPLYHKIFCMLLQPLLVQFVIDFFTTVILEYQKVDGAQTDFSLFCLD